MERKLPGPGGGTASQHSPSQIHLMMLKSAVLKPVTPSEQGSAFWDTSLYHAPLQTTPVLPHRFLLSPPLFLPLLSSIFWNTWQQQTQLKKSPPLQCPPLSRRGCLRWCHISLTMSAVVLLTSSTKRSSSTPSSLPAASGEHGPSHRPTQGWGTANGGGNARDSLQRKVQGRVASEVMAPAQWQDKDVAAAQKPLLAGKPVYVLAVGLNSCSTGWA